MAKTNHLACRTRDEFFAIVMPYAERTGLTLNQLSAHALGEASTLSRAVKRPERRIYLDTVDRTLSFIEKHPQGVS